MQVPAPEIATRIDIGPRDRQEDRVRAILNSDGSWVMSVADGLGGHPFGDEAAQAAVEALPDRIASNAEMAEAFDAANAAVWELHPEMRSGSRPETSFIALTTLVVAAWTPENGLLVSWVGDSHGLPRTRGRRSRLARTAARDTQRSGRPLYRDGAL